MFIVMAKMQDGTARTMRSFLSEQDAKRHAEEIMKACETSRQASELLRNIGEEPKFPNMVDYGARHGSLGTTFLHVRMWANGHRVTGSIDEAGFGRHSSYYTESIEEHSVEGYVFPNADAQVRYEEDKRNHQRMVDLWLERQREISGRIDRRFVDVQSVSIMKL